jgi:hypothetical protein
MFDLKAFIIDNIVKGVKNGTFSLEYGNIMAVNYFAKGLLTMDDVASIDAQTTEEITQEVIEEEVEEVVTDEIETGTEDTETEEEVEEVPAE